MKVRGSVFLIALLAVAVATSACRREYPEPRGLGAADIAAEQVVKH